MLSGFPGIAAGRPEKAATRVVDHDTNWQADTAGA